MSVLQNLKHECENKTNKINMIKSASALLLLKHQKKALKKKKIKQIIKNITLMQRKFRQSCNKH